MHSFAIKSADGAYYCISENPSDFDLNKRVDFIIDKVATMRLFSFMRCLAKTVIVCAKKKNTLSRRGYGYNDSKPKFIRK